MASIVTVVVLVIVGVAALVVWDRQRSRRGSGNSSVRAGAPEGDSGASTPERTIRAFSFQSDLSFAEACRILGVDGREDRESDPAVFGEWYERDSAWYPELLSCRSHRGMWLNLYYFGNENILEMKFDDSPAIQATAEDFALKELLPLLGAHDIKPTGSVN